MEDKDIYWAAEDLEILGDDIRWLELLSREGRKAIATRCTVPELLDGALDRAYAMLGDTLFPKDDSDHVALDQAVIVRDRAESIFVAVRWCGLAQYRWPELDCGLLIHELGQRLGERMEEFDQALRRAVSRKACIVALGWRFQNSSFKHDHWVTKL